MNNILTFEDYRKMNIRQVESVIYRQFIEEDIRDEVSEGFIRKAINKAAGNFIQNALADEIEKGKELEKSIKEALDGLDKGFEEIKNKIESNADDDNSKTKLSAIEKVKEAIKAVQSQAFDTLTMIGSEGEIDFAGFLGSATVAATVNFGVLLTPIRSTFMTRKAYKYFLGIIKQTIRRNLLVIQLNFDQFENLILQKSFETEEDSEFFTKVSTMTTIMDELTKELCDDKKNNLLKKSQKKDIKDRFEIFRKNMEITFKARKENYKNNPLSSLWQDQHNNTYTRTLEQIKQYINEDSQKELDALKSSITKMAGNDVDLTQFGELLMSAAEEYAIHTNHGINNNFIKMSSVFNLDNQKKLIELIKKSEDDAKEEIERKLKEKENKESQEEAEQSIAEGKKLYEEKLKDKDYTFDEFNDTFSESEQKCIRAFFRSDEGQDAYNELIEKNPLYKYFIFSDVELTNTFFNSIDSLEIVEVSNMTDFYDAFVDKEQTLYYMMAERSIKNAIKGSPSPEYFGFDISDKDVIDGVLSKDAFKKEEDKDGKEIPSKVEDLFNGIIKTEEVIKGNKTITVPKKKYFLTSSDMSNKLFNMLHNDFKTKIFKDSGEYESDISIENKETIVKLIHKELKIGNSISSIFAQYLTRLEAHMMLDTPEESWMVMKDDEELLEHFNHDEKKNKTAFVEIRSEHYEDIKKFLTKYHELSNNDFDLEIKEDNKTKEE